MLRGLTLSAGTHFRGPLSAHLVRLLVSLGVLGCPGNEEGPDRRMLALPVILAFAFLSGHVQEWYYLVLALSTWVYLMEFRSAPEPSVGATESCPW